MPENIEFEPSPAAVLLEIKRGLSYPDALAAARSKLAQSTAKLAAVSPASAAAALAVYNDAAKAQLAADEALEAKEAIIAGIETAIMRVANLAAKVLFFTSLTVAADEEILLGRQILGALDSVGTVGDPSSKSVLRGLVDDLLLRKACAPAIPAVVAEIEAEISELATSIRGEAVENAIDLKQLLAQMDQAPHRFSDLLKHRGKFERYLFPA